MTGTVSPKQDGHLSIEATIGIWSELEAARLGKNGYGGTVAEIYAYRLLPGGGVSEQHADRLTHAIVASANLTAILRQFRDAYPSCQIGIEEGVRKFRTLDLATEWIQPFDHRIHIEILDTTGKSADHRHDEIRRELRATAHGDTGRAMTRLFVEATLLLVEAVDRLTDAVDKHGGNAAAAIDYISDHLRGGR